MEDQPKPRRLTNRILPFTQWSLWWVGMWIVIAVGLLTSAFFMGVWHWLTLMVVAFGIPEFIGTLKHALPLPSTERFEHRRIRLVLV